MAGLLVLNTGKTVNQFDYVSNIQNILLNSYSLKCEKLFSEKMDQLIQIFRFCRIVNGIDE